MDGADESNSSPVTVNMDGGVLTSTEEEEDKVIPKQEEANNESKIASTGNEETMEDSPIMGVLTPKSEVGTQSSLSESTIKKAILERADHLQANSDKISLGGVRRLLEEDLGLDKNTLDAYKNLISRQVDQVLKGAKSMEDATKKRSDDVKSRKSKKVSSEDSDTSQSGSDELSDKVKLRKDAALRKNIKKFEQPRKRRNLENADMDISRKKPKKQTEEDINSDEGGSISEDGQSQLSIEKPAPRKEKPAPAYGKRVENLKSIIKACGMSVPPNIYKKVKGVPDDKRETILVKELEGILSKEGLSKNPTEKEIKDCRKKKERARELEGIDTSNIISSSRRRSTFSFVAPVRPVVHAKKCKGDANDIKKEENKDKNHNDDEKVEEKEKEVKEEEKGEEMEEDAEEEEEDDGDDEEEDDADESEEFDEGDNEESD